MTKHKSLYLEERVAIARRALNELTMAFQEALPLDRQEGFRDFVLSVMATPEGNPDGPKALAEIRKRGGK